MGEQGLPTWMYITACLVVPALWGIVSAWIFGKLDNRKSEHDTNSPANDSSA